MNIKDVEILASLARIELGEEEKKDLLSDMESILGYVKQIEEINARVKTYDNNLGFFKSSSKGVNPFMKEIEDKINVEKRKIAEFNDKRKMVIAELNKLRAVDVEK